MSRIYLHGGGDSEQWRQETFGRFAASSMENDVVKLALVIAEENESAARESWQAYSNIFTAVGVPIEKLYPIYVSPQSPLTHEMVAQAAPSGIFVCGGVTPFYHQAVCTDLSWLDYLRESAIPFGGTSAGAAIAAQAAILGGWQATRQERSREILFIGAGEGLDLLTVRRGLGLVPFAVDVHASQLGTLTRLIHTVELGLVPEGWAIDENTMLVIDGRNLQIYGQGHCYRVWQDSDGCVKLTVHTVTPSLVE